MKQAEKQAEYVWTWFARERPIKPDEAMAQYLRRFFKHVDEIGLRVVPEPKVSEQSHPTG